MKKQQANQVFKSDEDVWARAVPIWFRFLEWIIVIGIFNFLTSITHHWLIKVVNYLNYIGLGMYIQSILFSLDHVYIKNKKIKKIITIIFSTIITIVVLVFVAISVEQIKRYL